MKLAARFLAGFLCLSINLTAFIALPAQTAFGQDSKTALQRGYRTGYSDGYMAGYRDIIDKSVKDITRHSDYDKASRAYNNEYGALDDYRDGYRQGFELGYAAGFEKKSFESTVPENIERRGLNQITTPVEATAPPQPVHAPAEPPVSVPAAKTEVPAVETKAAEPTAEQPATQQPTGSTYSDSTQPAAGNVIKTTFTPVSDAVIIIPKDTELILELEQELTTSKNKAGDRFTAKIISPTELSGAVVEGRITKITRPGHIKRRSEMQLSFDRIVLNESRWSNYSATLIQVYPAKGDNIKRVDNEGLAQGTRPHKSDFIKVGAATGTGTVIGAIAGGPVGAGIGAGVGAAVGVGAVIIERGNHINLRNSQQLRVRTSYETQIR